MALSSLILMYELSVGPKQMAKVMATAKFEVLSCTMYIEVHIYCEFFFYKKENLIGDI